MVLCEGVDNTKKWLFFVHIQSETERIKSYVEHIEKIFNTNILGDDNGPAQRCLPYDNDNKSVGIIWLDDNRIWQVILEFDALVQATNTSSRQVIET